LPLWEILSDRGNREKTTGGEVAQRAGWTDAKRTKNEAKIRQGGCDQPEGVGKGRASSNQKAKGTELGGVQKSIRNPTKGEFGVG